MAEKPSPSKKRPPRQQMLEALGETEKTVATRRDAQAKPEEKIEARNVSQAVAVADELSTEGVVKSISELKSVVGKTLSQLSDRLEEQVARYVQIQRAIIAKDQELKEIYEIQRSASTLTALIETYERQRQELAAEHAALKDELEEEIEKGRAEWDAEQTQREVEAKERETGEQKRREREKEEYRYTFAREQQQAKDRFADEMATAQKALAEQKAASERELTERERIVKAAE